VATEVAVNLMSAVNLRLTPTSAASAAAADNGKKKKKKEEKEKGEETWISMNRRGDTVLVTDTIKKSKGKEGMGSADEDD
jgi:hypothetical protein